MNGFAGKLLHGRLDSGDLRVKQPDEKFYGAYTGGSAMGLIYAFNPFGADHESSEHDGATTPKSSVHDLGFLAFDVHVASGPNSAEPHHLAHEREFQPADQIWIDMGARVGEYCADLTRSFVVGESDQQFKAIYEVVLRAQLAAEHALKASLKLG